MNPQEAPATKQDLEDLKRELLAADMQLKEELLAADTRLKEELLEAMREIETHLLQAFYGFADGNHKHLAELDHSDASLRERLSTLEKRFTELERRINFPHFNP